MRTKIVKVSRPMVSIDGQWFAADEKGEHAEEFDPDAFVREAMGGRMVGYFRGVWSADGWHFHRFLARLPNRSRF
jgi:hypothetical protein